MSRSFRPSWVRAWRRSPACAGRFARLDTPKSVKETTPPTTPASEPGPGLSLPDISPQSSRFSISRTEGFSSNDMTGAIPWMVSDAPDWQEFCLSPSKSMIAFN